MLKEDIFDDASDKALALRNRVKYSANTSKRNRWKKAYRNLKLYKKRHRYLLSKEREVEDSLSKERSSFTKYVKSLKKKLDGANSKAYKELSGSSKKGGGPLSQMALKKDVGGAITLNIPNSFKYNQTGNSGYPYERIAELYEYFDAEKVYADIPIAKLEETDQGSVKMVRAYDNKLIYEGPPSGAVTALEEDVGMNTTKYFADYMDFDILTKLYSTELSIYVAKMDSRIKQLISGIKKESNSIKESKLIGEGLVKSDFNIILRATPADKQERFKILKKEVGSDPIVIKNDGSEEYAILYPLGRSEYIGVRGVMSNGEFNPFAKTYLYGIESPINEMPTKKDQKGVWDQFNRETISTYIKGVRKIQSDEEKKEKAPTIRQQASRIFNKAKKVVSKGIEFGKRGFTQKSFLARLVAIDSEMVEEVARIISEYESIYSKMLSVTEKQIITNRTILRKP